MLTDTDLAGYLVLGGVASLGDGSGGIFYWSAATTTADDGTTVIRPSSTLPANPGRWLLLGQQSSGSSVAGLGQGANLQSAPYAVQSSDRGKLISVSTPTSITVPSASSLGAGFVVAIATFYGLGSGATTISGTTQTFCTPHGLLLTSLSLRPGESVILMARSGNTWQVVGASGYNAQGPALIGDVVALIDAATIATDASQGTAGDVTLAASRTMGVPTNPSNNQRFLWRITQGGAGSNLITWDPTAFDFGAAGAPTLSTAVGKTDLIAGVYNSVATKWQMVPASLGYN